MSKLSIIQKEKKRFFLFNKYIWTYKYLKHKLKNLLINYNKNLNEITNINFIFQSLPRNSNGTRIRNRCFLTGRPRGVYRRFGLSRSFLRDLSFKGYIPGILKNSW